MTPVVTFLCASAAAISKLKMGGKLDLKICDTLGVKSTHDRSGACVFHRS